MRACLTYVHAMGALPLCQPTQRPQGAGFFPPFLCFALLSPLSISIPSTPPPHPRPPNSVFKDCHQGFVTRPRRGEEALRAEDAVMLATSWLEMQLRSGGRAKVREG